MEFPADTFLVELLIALLVQTVIVGAACLFKACKNIDHAEPGAQPDVEMGTVTGGEGIDRPASFLSHEHLASNGDTHYEGDTDPTENTASLQHGFADSDGRANRPEAHFPAVVDHLVTDDEIIEASAPIVVDVSRAQQVEVLV